MRLATYLTDAELDRVECIVYFEPIHFCIKQFKETYRCWPKLADAV